MATDFDKGGDARATVRKLAVNYFFLNRNNGLATANLCFREGGDTRGRHNPLSAMRARACA